MYNPLIKLVSRGRIIVLCALLVLVISSCGPRRNLAYMSDLPDTAAFNTTIAPADALIQPADMLGITVTNVDPETSNLFNKGILPAANPVAVGGTTASTVSNDGYVVDKTGNISFPSIGTIKVEGLTTDEVVVKLTTAIGKLAKNPIVQVRLLNFKVSVLGEVVKPGMYNIPGSRVNLFEALALAGDMTIYGRREDVLVMREQDGKRSITHFNLNSKNVLQQPAFYLKQNDIVYVKPDKMKEKQARTDTKTISIIVAAATVITVIISRLF